VVKNELKEIIGTSPMPPLPIYMLSGSSFAIFTISGCILLSNKYEGNKIIDAFVKTGQLALTFYVAHIIIGMGIIETINPEKWDFIPLDFQCHMPCFILPWIKAPVYEMIRQKAAERSDQILCSIVDELKHFQNGFDSADDVTLVVVKI
jgi:hypothetical protein